VVSPDKQHLLVTALRDFFIARDRAAMTEACWALMAVARTPLLLPDDWEEVEFAYNRLFVGPGSVAAPPYASIYLESEPFVMGETTRKVRSLYQMIGCVSPWAGQAPEDHLALELDACLRMRAGMQQKGCHGMEALYSYFLNEHLLRWVPRFISRVTMAWEVPYTIHWVCRELSRWLNREKARVDGAAPRAQNF